MGGATDGRHRILIVRLSAIGDVIHGLPVLCALRQHFPDAFLGWIVDERAADLLVDHPAIDALIRVPRGWLKSPRELCRIRRQLRSLRFDVTVDLQCLTKSAVAARLSGARRRIGVAGSDGREFSKWLHNELVDAHAENVIEHYLQLLRPLGIESPEVEFRLPERPPDREFVEEFLASAGLKTESFVILNPGASWPSKLWPTERYGELASRLASHSGLRSVIVWGGQGERDLAEEIASAAGPHAVIATATSLRQLAALCRRARLFVGSDTGPLHLAVAVGTRSVSLHGTTDASWTGAYGPHNLRLQVAHHVGSARERRQADNSAMRAICVDMVVEACITLLSQSTCASETFAA